MEGGAVRERDGVDMTANSGWADEGVAERREDSGSQEEKEREKKRKEESVVRKKAESKW